MKNLVCGIAILIVLPGASVGAQEKKNLSSTQAVPDLGITVRRISPRAAVVNVGPWDNSYWAFATKKGIVVIDSGFSDTVARQVRATIQAEFKRSDFAYLINSHEHSDHTFGNSAYSDIPIVGSNLLREAILAMKADRTIIADRLAIPQQGLAQTQEELKKGSTPEAVKAERFWKTVQADYNSGMDFVPPNVTFDRRMTLDLGDISVHLFSYGHWHSKADTIISIPEEGLVRLGALFSSGRLSGGHLPVFNSPYGPQEKLTSAIVDNWIETLNAVLSESNEKTQFISCHGWTVMTKDEVSPQVAYMEKLWNEVRREKAAGRTLTATKESLSREKRFPEAASLMNSAEEIPNIHEHNIESLWNAAP